MIRFDRATAEWVVAVREHPRWSISAAAGVPSMTLGALLSGWAGGWVVLSAVLTLVGLAVLLFTLLTSKREGPAGSP